MEATYSRPAPWLTGSYHPRLTRNKTFQLLLEKTGGFFSPGLHQYLGGSDLETFIFRLSLRLYSVSAAPGDLIINSADGDTVNLTVYILLTGSVQLFCNTVGSGGGGTSAPAENQVVRLIDYEDSKACFGAFELFERDAPPEWCVEAAEFCDMSYIDRAALKGMMEQE